MSEQTMGIDYFGIETDIKDDDKVFALRYKAATANGGYDSSAAYAAFGRLIDLLADIYREGFAAEMTPSRCVRLSQQMGFTLEDLDDFISLCVDAELFDREFWEQDRVLTSRGIQKRYYIVASRRKGTIPESQRKYLLIDDAPGIDEGQPEEPKPVEAAESAHDVNTMQQDVAMLQHDVTTLQHDAESCGTREEKRRERKGRKDKGKERAPNEIGAVVSSLEKNLSSPLPGRKKRHQQPYPLSCLSQAGEGRLYDDGMGGEHESPWDALVMRLKYKSPDCDIGSFAAKVSETCPPECPESPECVSECYRLMCGALDRFQRNKCASPVPLIVKVLKEDRGKGR